MFNTQRLFKLKESDPSPIVNNTTIEKSDFISYRNKGKQESIEVLGSYQVLDANLKDLYQQFLNDQRNKVETQEALKVPIRAEKLATEGQITELQKRIILGENCIKELDDDNGRIEKEIVDVAANPVKYGLRTNTRPGILFYLGVVFLLGLTLFLLAFYSSAFFNAFIKSHKAGESLAEGMSDPEMFSQIHGAQWLLVIFGPFIFLALGYLIHMFNKDKEKGTEKLIYLLTITFVFDLILAFFISKRFFEAQHTNTQEFGFMDAIGMVEFWGFIFCGFVVYLVWGFVLDFVIQLFEELDQVWGHIKGLKSRKKINLKSREQQNSSIDNWKIEIQKLSSTLKKIEDKLESFIIPQKQYYGYMTNYFAGWITSIGESHIPIPGREGEVIEKRDRLITNCERVRDNHIKDLDLSNNNMDNTQPQSI